MGSFRDRTGETGDALRWAGRIAAFALLGAVGTGASATLLLNLLQPIQAWVYRAVYLQVGPSEATETAILAHFLVAGFAALGIVMVLGDSWSDRLAHRAALAKAMGVLLALLFGFLGVALVGLAAVPVALVVVTAALVAVPLLLRYRFGVRSGGTLAFVGGIPVVVLLLLLAGFGIGWGWGYVVTAQEVPAPTVNQTVVTFDDVPEIRTDLFVAGDCSTDADGRRVCYLQLRGYEHELTTTRFLARHGVHCPYQSRQPGRAGALVARIDGTHYRVSCSPHGD